MTDTPSAPSTPQVTVLPAEAADDQDLMRQLTDLVNQVYATAEDGLWQPGTVRTSLQEVTELTLARQIVVAHVDGALAGLIRVQYLDSDTAETGMLVSHPDYRGLGVGRELRRFVAEMLRREGFKTLQIELLVPRNRTHDSKAFMAEWNTRAGYEVVGESKFEDYYPDLAPRLVTPCNFIIFNKSLQTA